MKLVTKKVWQCDFCGRHRFTKEGMERHERSCPQNPKSVKNLLDRGVRYL